MSEALTPEEESIESALRSRDEDTPAEDEYGPEPEDGYHGPDPEDDAKGDFSDEDQGT